jgi:hypothetical protein
MTVPLPTLDKFTHLGEMGYTQKTLPERLDKFYKDLTALNPIGELLERSLDQAMAREVIGVTPGGGPPVTKDDVGLGNVDNTSDLNKPISSATQNALNLKADKTALATTDNNVTALSNSVSSSLNTKLDKANPTATGTATVVNLVVTGTTSFVDGSIAVADVNGLSAALGSNGNLYRLIGDVPRRVGGVAGGALILPAPQACVDWVTVGLSGYPAAFDFNGDTLQNAQV